MRANSTTTTGRKGEELATGFLHDLQYEILARNYRWARGEIDIVARKAGVLVFVEVKTASGKSFGEPETWVTPRKQKQIGLVAERYLQEHGIQDMDCRFDVIAVKVDPSSHSIKHIENAFWL